MFKEVVSSTALSGGYIDAAMQFIVNARWCPGIQEDVSLESTLRALLKDRVENGERVMIWWGQLNRYSVSGSTSERIWSSVYGMINSTKNMLNIINVDQSQSKAFEVVDEYMPNRMTAWHKVEKITAFFKKSFKVSCYINEDVHNTILFVEEMDMRKFHFIQCCVTLFFPWYFKPEEKLKDEEMRLIRSLTGDSKAEYLSAIEAIAPDVDDMRAFAIENMLRGFEQHIYERKSQSLKESVRSLDSDIERYREAIAELIQRRTKKQVELFGWEHMKETASERDEELKQYFINNKHVDIVSAENRIEFTTKGYLSQWEEKGLDDGLITYDRSALYISGDQRKFSSEDRKRLIIAIFKDRKIKLRICSAYYIDIDSAMMDGIRGFDYPGYYETYMPNPHIDRYKCIGQYASIFAECMEMGNYTLAVDQAIMSAQSLNLYDGAVYSDLFDRMFGRMSEKNYLELPDGSIVNTKEAIDWLKKEEGNGETDQSE